MFLLASLPFSLAPIAAFLSPPVRRSPTAWGRQTLARPPTSMIFFSRDGREGFPVTLCQKHADDYSLCHMTIPPVLLTAEEPEGKPAIPAAESGPSLLQALTT
ncbi:hypothetical protein TgHK011_003305 [Trichoderma gracile]|nr:hypothetical protein TgHK011_003305 [Trichoderma gracile]